MIAYFDFNVQEKKSANFSPPVTIQLGKILYIFQILIINCLRLILSLNFNLKMLKIVILEISKRFLSVFQSGHKSIVYTIQEQ